MTQYPENCYRKCAEHNTHSRHSSANISLSRYSYSPLVRESCLYIRAFMCTQTHTHTNSNGLIILLLICFISATYKGNQGLMKSITGNLNVFLQKLERVKLKIAHSSSACARGVGTAIMHPPYRFHDLRQQASNTIPSAHGPLLQRESVSDPHTHTEGPIKACTSVAG